MDFVNLFINNQELFFGNRKVEEGFRKAFKGDWGAQVHIQKPGVSQELNRLSYFGFLCQLRKTNLNISADGAKMMDLVYYILLNMVFYVHYTRLMVEM